MLVTVIVICPLMVKKSSTTQHLFRPLPRARSRSGGSGGEGHHHHSSSSHHRHHHHNSNNNRKWMPKLRKTSCFENRQDASLLYNKVLKRTDSNNI
mmetsp:Transcript_26272/g.36854  ORF Transcript_26272/g.36854 Transcript_26272/m.36854 type:complete len:96 (-) Transcript_26272:77-364(-)